MARFYGSIQGCRGQATRLGGAGSGLRTVAASWSGSVKVYLRDHDGVDWCHVTLDTWNGAGKAQVLYDGPVDVTKADDRVRWNLAHRTSNAKRGKPK
jgi:hypothetical protein